jgi:hypothetical protein
VASCLAVSPRRSCSPLQDGRDLKCRQRLCSDIQSHAIDPVCKLWNEFTPQELCFRQGKSSPWTRARGGCDRCISETVPQTWGFSCRWWRHCSSSQGKFRSRFHWVCISRTHRRSLSQDDRAARSLPRDRSNGRHITPDLTICQENARRHSRLLHIGNIHDVIIKRASGPDPRITGFNGSHS